LEGVKTFIGSGRCFSDYTVWANDCHVIIVVMYVTHVMSAYRGCLYASLDPSLYFALKIVTPILFVIFVW
jgi:hypothetical protein